MTRSMFLGVNDELAQVGVSGNIRVECGVVMFEGICVCWLPTA